MMLAEVQVPGNVSEIRLDRGVAPEKFDGARDALIVSRARAEARNIFQWWVEQFHAGQNMATVRLPPPDSC
jgi:hypothetical protein